MGKKLTEVAKSINAANARMKRNAKTLCNQASLQAKAERFSSDIVQQLDVLNERRKEWEATDYKKANDGLYALLGGCLSIYKSQFVNGNDDEKKELRKSLVERLLYARADHLNDASGISYAADVTTAGAGQLAGATSGSAHTTNQHLACKSLSNLTLA